MSPPSNNTADDTVPWVFYTAENDCVYCKLKQQLSTGHSQVNSSQLTLCLHVNYFARYVFLAGGRVTVAIWEDVGNRVYI